MEGNLGSDLTCFFACSASIACGQKLWFELLRVLAETDSALHRTLHTRSSLMLKQDVFISSKCLFHLSKGLKRDSKYQQ